MGLKAKDLYKITLKEFLNQNPEYKKQSKEIQNQRFELFEEERQSNINRCILKRQELIANTKKVKPKEKNYKKNYDEDSEEDIFDFNDYNDLKLKYKVRNSDDNYIIRKNFSSKKQKFIPKNMILITDNSYVMNKSNGQKSELTKDEVSKYTCIQNEKKKLVKKAETKDEHLMRYLKVQLDRAKELNKVKEKLNKKDEKIKKFIKVKNKGLKQMENERYKDHQDVFERQKIYEKILSNYDQQIYITKKQQQEQNKQDDKSKTLEPKKLSKEKSKTKTKMDELKELIKDYEKKNDEYKQRISDMFELKDAKEKEEKIKEKRQQKEENTTKKSSSYLMKKKLTDMGDKIELEKIRRENALMNSMNLYQTRINKFLKENEVKEQKIKEAILKADQERNERKQKMANHMDTVRKNIENNEKEKAEKRQKLIEDIERKDLKDYAIKQEKLKMVEERRKMNKLNKEEREAMKLKIQDIIKKEKNIAEGEDNEEIIKKLLNETHKTINKNEI